jgi:hypothetical protein
VGLDPDIMTVLIFAVPPGLAMLWATRRIARHPLLRLLPVLGRRLGLVLWLLPAALYALWAVGVVVDVRADPTSHNLLPFEAGWVLAHWIAYALVLRVGLGMGRSALRLWLGG